jgi:hypothetical protein
VQRRTYFCHESTAPVIPARTQLVSFAYQLLGRGNGGKRMQCTAWTWNQDRPDGNRNGQFRFFGLDQRADCALRNFGSQSAAFYSAFYAAITTLTTTEIAATAAESISAASTRI